jgi:hypothetical protein
LPAYATLIDRVFADLTVAWLRAQWIDLAGSAAGSKPADPASICRELFDWQHHAGLAGVRDPAALGNRPAAERRQWQQFRADVDAFVRDETRAK